MRKIFFSLVVLLFGLASFSALQAGSETSETSTTARTTAAGGVPRFTLDDAVLTALQRNPQIQVARQEIERTKGIYLQVRGEI
ncbi:MAG TPA: hypothetical protein VGC85_07925, partial [Chthoniobacterales bacterium]